MLARAVMYARVGLEPRRVEVESSSRAHALFRSDEGGRVSSLPFSRSIAADLDLPSSDAA